MVATLVTYDVLDSYTPRRAINKLNANNCGLAQHNSQSDSNAIIADLDERGVEFVAMIRGSSFGD